MNFNKIYLIRRSTITSFADSTYILNDELGFKILPIAFECVYVCAKPNKLGKLRVLNLYDTERNMHLSVF